MRPPAEAAAGVTGQTLEQVTAEKLETGKTYGAIANDAGKLAEFKDAMIQMKQEELNERVAEGTITQERANDIMAVIEERTADCDGTGPADGTRLGGGFGRGGSGAGKGAGRGQGYGMGGGQGTCLYQ